MAMEYKGNTVNCGDNVFDNTYSAVVVPNGFEQNDFCGATIAKWNEERTKAEIEGKYHKFCNAGHIFYTEIDGDISQNIDAFENILHIMSNNDIGYGAVNIPIVECTVCGTSWRGDSNVCPGCGRDEREPIEC